jgi:molybdenum cofactor cytidylyltransferase
MNKANKSTQNVRIGCIIMASGESTRFGCNKLVQNFMGRPLGSYIMETVAASDFTAKVVVTRWTEVAELARGFGLAVLLHAWPLVSDTIRLGTCYFTGRITGFPEPDGIMFCVADQPLLRPSTVHRMAEAFSEHRTSIIRLSGPDAETGKQRFANPVIFPATLFAELKKLSADRTGKHIIERHERLVRTVPAEDRLELEDADTEAQLRQLEQAAGFSQPLFNRN